MLASFKMLYCKVYKIDLKDISKVGFKDMKFNKAIYLFINRFYLFRKLQKINPFMEKFVKK